MDWVARCTAAVIFAAASAASSAASSATSPPSSSAAQAPTHASSACHSPAPGSREAAPSIPQARRGPTGDGRMQRCVACPSTTRRTPGGGEWARIWWERVWGSAWTRAYTCSPRGECWAVRTTARRGNLTSPQHTPPTSPQKWGIPHQGTKSFSPAPSPTVAQVPARRPAGGSTGDIPPPTHSAAAGVPALPVPRPPLRPPPRVGGRRFAEARGCVARRSQ